MLASRARGATVASLTLWPVCHVVFFATVHDLSPFLFPNLPSSCRCKALLSLSRSHSEMEAILKTPTILLFSSCSPLFNRNKTHSPLMVGNLISVSVKCLKMWPLPGVACHIQLWAPNKKAAAHLSLFSSFSADTSIKNRLLFLDVGKNRKALKSLFFFFLHGCSADSHQHQIGSFSLSRGWKRTCRCCSLFFWNCSPGLRWHFNVRTHTDYIIWGSGKGRCRGGREWGVRPDSPLSVSLCVSPWLQEFDKTVWMWWLLLDYLKFML